MTTIGNIIVDSLSVKTLGVPLTWNKKKSTDVELRSVGTVAYLENGRAGYKGAMSDIPCVLGTSKSILNFNSYFTSDFRIGFATANTNIDLALIDVTTSISRNISATHDTIVVLTLTASSITIANSMNAPIVIPIPSILLGVTVYPFISSSSLTIGFSIKISNGSHSYKFTTTATGEPLLDFTGGTNISQSVKMLTNGGGLVVDGSLSVGGVPITGVSTFVGVATADLQMGIHQISALPTTNTVSVAITDNDTRTSNVEMIKITAPNLLNMASVSNALMNFTGSATHQQGSAIAISTGANQLGGSGLYIDAPITNNNLSSHAIVVANGVTALKAVTVAYNEFDVTTSGNNSFIVNRNNYIMNVKGGQTNSTANITQIAYFSTTNIVVSAQDDSEYNYVIDSANNIRKFNKYWAEGQDNSSFALPVGFPITLPSSDYSYMTISNSTSKIVTAKFNGSSINTYNTINGALINQITSIPNLYGIALNTTGQILYAADHNNGIYSINLVNGTVNAPGGGYPIAPPVGTTFNGLASSTDGFLYATISDGRVIKYSQSTGALVVNISNASDITGNNRCSITVGSDNIFVKNSSSIKKFSSTTYTEVVLFGIWPAPIQPSVINFNNPSLGSNFIRTYTGTNRVFNLLGTSGIWSPNIFLSLPGADIPVYIGTLIVIYANGIQGTNSSLNIILLGRIVSTSLVPGSSESLVSFAPVALNTNGKAYQYMATPNGWVRIGS
jgi:hypothetical protein